MANVLTMEQFLNMDTALDERSNWQWTRMGVDLAIKSVPPKTQYAARKKAANISVIGGKKGKAAERKVDFDELQYKSDIIVAGLDGDAGFRIDDPQVLAKYGKLAARDCVTEIFLPKEIDSLAEAILAISDVTDDEDAETDVKN